MTITSPEPVTGPVRSRLGPLPRPARRVLGSRLVAALTTPHGPDRYLEHVHPLWSLDETRALVADVRRETDDTTTLTLTPTTRLDLDAGQHVRVTVEIDGVRRTRAFSVSSSAHRADGRLQITVRANPDGHVSRFLAHEARPGLLVGLEPGDGAFLLPDPRPDDLLLVSGGSGITPVMAMLRTLADEGHNGRVTFLHYARRADEVIFAEELRRLGEREGVDVHVVLTGEQRPETNALGLTGRVCAEHLTAVAGDLRAPETFACGPAGLLEAVEAALDDHGAADRLHVERYQAPGGGGALGDAQGRITFTESGIAVDSDGRSVLEQAEDAGLSPDFGCRMGICHGCVQRKPRGALQEVRSGAVHDEDDEDVQLCVTVPVGDVEIAI